MKSLFTKHLYKSLNFSCFKNSLFQLQIKYLNSQFKLSNYSFIDMLEMKPNYNKNNQIELPEAEMKNKPGNIAKRKREKRKTKKQISLRYR